MPRKMAKFVCVLAVLISAVYGEFTCDDMRVDHLDQTRLPYRIDTGSPRYVPGEKLTITLTHRNNELFKFIIQASHPTSWHTLGSWVAVWESEATRHCDIDNHNNPDTFEVESLVSRYEVTWQAPGGDKLGDATSVEFFVIFEDRAGNRSQKHSIIVDPVAEPSTKLPEPTKLPEQPEVEDREDDKAMHDTRTEDQLKMDAMKKKHDEIDLENQASEDDWNKQEIEDMRLRDEEIHREEMEYEENLRKEVEEQEARIRAEIRDKEEFDHLEREKERIDELEKELEKEIEDQIKPRDRNEIEIDASPAGASHIVAGVACLVVLAVQIFL